MEKWSFWHSGIEWAKLEREGGEAKARLLDVKKASFGPWAPYGEAEDSALSALCSRSVSSIFAEVDEMEYLASTPGASFTTTSGRVFSRRGDGDWYQRKVKFPLDLKFEEGRLVSVVMTGRDYTSVLCREGHGQNTPVAMWNDFNKTPLRPVVFRGTFTVPTRDGEELAADVWLPMGDGPFGAVLVRTPYGKGKGVEPLWRFVMRGYALVVQDTRGREDSSGEWLPNYHEIEDGDDTVSWIASQCWSDGNVAMTGGSYLGYTQWCAAASGNPHLKAMLSFVTAGSAYGDVPRRGGCFNSGMLAWGFAMTEKRMRPDLMVRDDWDEVLDIRPLADIPQKALGKDVPFLSRWLNGQDDHEMWSKASWKDRWRGRPVPALIISGWFDDNGMGTTEALDLVKSWPEGTWKAVLGPWKHSGNANYDIHALELGPNPLRYDIDLLCLLWLERFMKGVENGVEKGPALEYYTIGAGEWRTSSSWPPAETVETTLHLKSGARRANGDRTRCGGGILSFEEDGSASTESYLYDPRDPATHIIDMSENELEVPEDYTEEEKRPDILSFTTEVFTEPFTVTGDMLVTLALSSDAPDTDIFVRITDVGTDGRSIKLADGMLDLKYRDGFGKPSFLEKGREYEVTIRTTKISNSFLPGHRLRLTITSSAKNFCFPNSNTEKGYDSPVTRVAEVKVRPSGSKVVLRKDRS